MPLSGERGGWMQVRVVEVLPADTRSAAQLWHGPKVLTPSRLLSIETYYDRIVQKSNENGAILLPARLTMGAF